MDLNRACLNILSQLASLVEQILEHDFTSPSELLSNATVGQHVRHTLEFFICFENGFEKGVINYDKRSHNKLIETNKIAALATIERISNFVMTIQEEKHLKLEAAYNLSNDDFVTINTTVNRELVYNIEHAIHHMAIIKIAIRQLAPYIQLPFNFGLAASTVRYKQSILIKEG